MSIHPKDKLYNVREYTDAEIYRILDLNSNPSDRELEAKILHNVNKYSNIGNDAAEKLAQFFIDIYTRFFVVDNDEYDYIGNGEKEGFDTQSGEEDTPDLTTPGVPTALPDYAVGTPIVKMVEFSRDKLNPLLKETISKTVSIDSQYRENKKSVSTHFTLSLSEPLRNVVSLKLYSYQIPYTWYTVNNSFGGNFFLIKGNADGINNGNHDYTVSIKSGNYTPANLVTAINNSIQQLKTAHTDVDFGDTEISYNLNNALATMNVDITKVFGSANYYLEFPADPLNPPAGNAQLLGRYMGFNYKTYSCSALYSSRDLPLTDNSPTSTDNVASIYVVDTSNYAFHIVKYSGDTYHTATTIHETINVELTLVGKGSKPRNAIVTDLSNVLATHPKLDHTHTYIRRIDIIDERLENNQKSYFVMNVKLNRNTTSNVAGAKLAVVFPEEQVGDDHNPIWIGTSSCFHFEYEENEMNMIIAESEMNQSNYVVSGEMAIKLECNVYPYNVSYNTYDIRIPNSTVDGYILSEYISTLNTSIVTANTTYSISDDLNDLNYPNTKIELDENNILNFPVDLNRIFRNRYYSLHINHKYIGNIAVDLSNANTYTAVSYFNIGSYVLDTDDIITLIPKPETGFVANVDAGILDMTIEQLLNVTDGTNTTTVIAHPKYAKYFHMLDAGFDVEFIKTRMIQDGADPDYLDTPDAEIPAVKTSVTYTNFAQLQNGINTLFTNFRDYLGDRPLRNSRVSLTTVSVGMTTMIRCELTLIVNKTISQLDYTATFYDSEAASNEDNRWITQLYFNPLYIIQDAPLNAEGESLILNNSPISDNEIVVEKGINDYFYLRPYPDVDGLYSTNSSYDVRVEIPPRTYSRNTLYYAINQALANTALASSSFVESYMENGKEYTMFHMNVFKVFSTKDYRIVFYDPYSFSQCNSSGVNQSVRNATWDTTIGWLLGFRENSTYFPEDYIASPTKLNYFDTTNTNMCVLTGDTCVTVSLYNYFLIVLDDYNQNHLNDGLVTTTLPEKLVDTGTNLQYVCDPITNTRVLSSITTKNGATTQYTASQLYSMNQKILAKKVRNMSYSTGPFVKDVFALIPINTSKYDNGSYITETTGSLQVQERVYFGPVNIQRMTVKLVNDRGDLVDLNNSNWSFSIQCQCLSKADIK